MRGMVVGEGGRSSGVLLYLFLWFFGHDEAIGAVISSLILSCHEIRAFVFKGYWYNLIHDLSFQVGTCDGTSMTKITNTMHQETPYKTIQRTIGDS